MNTCSIVLPVYNGEDFVEETVQSIIRNMREEDELIIVNDGSKDSSEAICSRYVSDNVHLVNQPNAGVSVARNKAIQMCSKDYLFFVDSDDLVCEAIFDYIHQQDFENSDMVIGRNMIHLQNQTKEEQRFANLKDFVLTNHEQIVTDFIRAKDNLGIWAVWRHLFKREFIQREQILFNKEYTYGEDMDFIIQALLKAQSFAILDKPLVKYRIYESSVSGIYSLKSMKSQIAVLYKWQAYFAKSVFKNENKQRIVSKLANKQLATLAHVSHLSNSDRALYLEKFKQTSMYLKQASGKFKLVYVVGKCVGYERVSKWLGGK